MNKSSIKRKLPNLSISPDNFVYDKPMSNTFLANSTYSPCIFAYFINIRGLIASVPIAEPIERKGLIRVTVALSRSSLANNLPIFLRLWQSPRAQKRAFRVQKYKKIFKVEYTLQHYFYCSRIARCTTASSSKSKRKYATKNWN